MVLSVKIAGAKTILVDFSRRTIQKRNITVSSRGIRYNSHYGSSWLMLYPRRSKIVGSFELSNTPSKATLTITHLSSASSNAKGGGYSPINIILNGRLFKGKYDVAENHSGSHSYNTDQWNIARYLKKGTNTIELKFCSQAQTHYWIQSLKIELEEKVEKPVFKPSGATIGLPEPRPEVSKWHRLKCYLLSSSETTGPFKFRDIFVPKVDFYPEKNELIISARGCGYTNKTHLYISVEGLRVKKASLDRIISLRKKGKKFDCTQLGAVGGGIYLSLPKLSSKKIVRFTLSAVNPAEEGTIKERLKKFYLKCTGVEALNIILGGINEEVGITFSEYAVCINPKNPEKSEISSAGLRRYFKRAKGILKSIKLLFPLD